MLQIEQIRPELTWRLRREVLYPNSELSQMEMDEDKDGYHFGAFRDNQLAGVVSLFQDGTDFQFRKFAVVAQAQGTGVGTALLNYIMNFAIAEGAQRIWCNARVPAIGFYLQFGFERTGKLFSKNGLSYEIMEKIIRM
ncbi:GNAT family N-acetyltransferase [Mucilaginibacter sp. dw_454]|uniref:GNAT family N-acetyltransferase n=1 Tax=Mucilaginibacter sp. dw_454 TaxID=2720079 RepID=UPI001BD1EF07|nr:GNAT family N-acetyltransferase [Mucilaginibacter sp. dw_454]